MLTGCQKAVSDFLTLLVTSLEKAVNQHLVTIQPWDPRQNLILNAASFHLH